ncbi:MAG TPA: hypothetical protein VLL52_20080 [Anaerolineae bacterium]|nr:hypothetical protein [Anaerolineae bacterium]
MTDLNSNSKPQTKKRSQRQTILRGAGSVALALIGMFTLIIVGGILGESGGDQGVVFGMFVGFVIATTLIMNAAR